MIETAVAPRNERRGNHVSGGSRIRAGRELRPDAWEGGQSTGRTQATHWGLAGGEGSWPSGAAPHIRHQSRDRAQASATASGWWLSKPSWRVQRGNPSGRANAPAPAIDSQNH